MTSLAALPFLLAEPGYEVAEIQSVLDDGVELRGLSARFPAQVESHSREQQFYFTAEGLLRRHDYQVDIGGGIAAAHYLADYVELDGFLLPTRRTVHPRAADGSINRDLETVTVALRDYRLT